MRVGIRAYNSNLALCVKLGNFVKKLCRLCVLNFSLTNAGMFFK